jgi:hypothetical protein
MNMTAYNEGESPIHVIPDHDTINDSQIDAGAILELDVRGGVIELRELEVSKAATTNPQRQQINSHRNAPAIKPERQADARQNHDRRDHCRARHRLAEQ